MATVGRVVVEIAADTAKLVSELEKSSRQTATWGQRVERFAKTAIGLLGAYGLGRTLQNLATDAIRTGDALANLSNTSGISAQSIQELRFAMSQLSDATDSQVDSALVRFNQSLGDALNGSKEAARAFETLGVSIRGAGGQVRGTEQVFDDAMRALAGIGDSATRASLAVDLFGREAGSRMAGALSSGIKSLEEMRQAAPGVISNTNVMLAAELTDEFDRMARTVGGALKNAFIGATAAAGDFLGIVELSEVAAAILKVQELESQVAGFAAGAAANPGRARFYDARRQQLEVELAEARRQLQIERARAAGTQGFATRSFLVPTALEAFNADYERFIVAIKNANFEAEQFAAAAAVADEEWAKTLQNLIAEFEALEIERNAAAMAEEEKSQRAIDAAIREKTSLFELAEEQRRVSEEMKAQWEGFGKGLGRGVEDTLANAFLGIETSFGDMLERMLAQAAASGLLRYIGASATGGAATFFNFLGFGSTGSFGGSGKPMGGFSGGGGGASKPSIVYNIDARGAVEGTAAQIAKAIRDNNQTFKAELAYESSRGRF